MTATTSRTFCAAAWLVVATVLAMGAAAAQAEVVNGDFETALDGWLNSGASPPDNYVEAVFDTETASTVAHLHAEATYTYSGGIWGGYLQQAFIMQFPVTLDEGDKYLRFDGKALLEGWDVLDPTVTVIAIGGGGGGGSVNLEQWADYVFPLTDSVGDPLPGGTELSLLVQVIANPPASAGEEGQQITQVVDLYVDNFELSPYAVDTDMPFHEYVLAQLDAGIRGRELAAAIKAYREAQQAEEAGGGAPLPEPGTLSLLVLGACLPLLRRRR